MYVCMYVLYMPTIKKFTYKTMEIEINTSINIHTVQHNFYKLSFDTTVNTIK